jgi:segregation and condensation protein B
MGRPARKKASTDFDRELRDLPRPLREREFMQRVEAVIFASADPVTRERLTAVIGSDCNLDALIAAIRDELRARPYDIAHVGGGYQYRTREGFANVIRASGSAPAAPFDLSTLEQLTLTAIAYFQPITRAALGDIFGKPISRDTIGTLRRLDLIAAGPRSPQPGAPHTYVTTQTFLLQSGLASLRDLPDIDQLEEAGLLGTPPMPDELRSVLGLDSDLEKRTDDLETDDPLNPL